MNEMCTAFERRLFLIITIVYVKAHMSVLGFNQMKIKRAILN